ncbi:MAG: L-threonylcarbamoyladenylate synthase [Desulfosoma sp.]
MKSLRRWMAPFDELPRDLEELLRRGGVVIYPTETVYGLGGDPRNAAVLERIYALKGRPLHKPLPLIASNVETVQKWVQWRSNPLDRIAKRFWPGPLTLVLQASMNVPQHLTSKEGTLAVRVSAHPVALLLAEACGGMVVATSANLSGEAVVSNPAELSSGLLTEVDGLVDIGPLPPSPPSTILAVAFEGTRYSVQVLRKGAVSIEALREFFHGELVVSPMEEL